MTQVTEPTRKPGASSTCSEPGSMTVEGVYGTSILVVEQDAMDVEHVRLYGLQAAHEK